MSLVGIALLLPVAVVLELMWRGRHVDEHGNLLPSLREQAMLVDLALAIHRHERQRSGVTFGDRHDPRS